jgi:hypothetical protein
MFWDFSYDFCMGNHCGITVYIDTSTSVSMNFFFFDFIIYLAVPSTSGARQYTPIQEYKTIQSKHPFSSFQSQRVGRQIASCFFWPYTRNTKITSPYTQVTLVPYMP